jgi:hypothetical protein
MPPPDPIAHPWENLSHLEQRLLAPKLIAITDEEESPTENLRRAGEAFDRGILDMFAAFPESVEEISARILTVRNFMAQTGAYRNSPIWQQIARIYGFRKSYAELTVHDRDELLRILQAAGYRIINELPWSIHRFDSVRAVTTFADEPSLHFANDRADEEGYGPNYFFVHWDATSVCFCESRGWWRWIPGARWIEKLRAGLHHKKGFAAPDEVQGYLASERMDQNTDLA